MKTTTTFDRRKPADLKNHPLNAKVFGQLSHDADYSEFVESVKTHGILQPLVITKDNVILSGHRRKQAAMKCGLKEVPVIIRHDLNGGIESDFAWFETNRNREMTVEQRARWYETRKAIEESAARERLELTQSKPGSAVGSKARENFPSLQNTGKTGKSSEIAAADAGMSHRTADRAVEVVHAIDEAEAAGNKEAAEDLRQTLNTQSVAAAHRKAKPKPEPVDTPTEMTDTIGRPVPKKLNAAASAAAAIEALARKLDPLKRDVDALAQSSGGEFIDMTTVNRLAREMKTAISHARYWTACPRCGVNGCERCSQSGFIPWSKRGQLSAEDKSALGIE